jgi:hypothetical protein
MSGDVEPAPAGLHEVPPLRDADYAREDAASAAVASDAGMVDEDMIAPVVDIDGNGRSFRRRKGRKGGDAPVAPAESAVEAAQDPVVEEAAAAPATAPEHPAAEPGADEPSVSPVDSIDPENLVDAETLVEPEQPDEPDVAPAGPLNPDYDFEQTRATEAVLVPARPDADSDIRVETMVTMEPPDADADAMDLTPEPDVWPVPEAMVVIVEHEDEPLVTSEPDASDHAAGTEGNNELGLSVDWGKPGDPSGGPEDDPVAGEPDTEPKTR